LAFAASAFAAPIVLTASGADARAFTPPSATINLSTLTDPLTITGEVFSIVNLSGPNVADAKFSIKLVRVPTATFPTNYIAVEWTNNHAQPAATYNIDRVVTGTTTNIATNRAEGREPTTAGDPPQYTCTLVYSPTATTITITLTETNGSLGQTTIYNGAQAVSWAVAGDVEVQVLAELTHTATADSTSIIGGPGTLDDGVNLIYDLANPGAQAITGEPTNMYWGETGTPQADLTVTLGNVGTTTWSAADNYALREVVTPSAAVNRNFTSGLIPVSGSVAPGSPATFSLIPLTAPTTTGRYDVAFQLEKDGVLLPAGTETINIDVAKFQDVFLGDMFRGHIELLVADGVVLGKTLSPPTYDPNDIVTRRAMATFIGRAMKTYRQPQPFGTFDEWLPTTYSFTDVPLDAPLAGWIYACNNPIGAGAPGGTNPVVYGTTATTYDPEGIVDRATMAVFMQRAMPLDQLFPVTPTFSDVPADYWAFGSIEAIADPTLVPYPVTIGCGDGSNYCPEEDVTRRTMAVYIVRGFKKPGTEPDPTSTEPLL
jgi:hypothetical protein